MPAAGVLDALRDAIQFGESADVMLEAGIHIETGPRCALFDRL